MSLGKLLSFTFPSVLFPFPAPSLHSLTPSPIISPLPPSGLRFLALAKAALSAEELGRLVLMHAA